MGQRKRWIGMELTEGWEGSKMGSRRLVVAAAEIMAAKWKRWIRTGAEWAGLSGRV